MTGDKMGQSLFLRRAIAAIGGLICLVGVAVVLNSVESRSGLVLGATAVSALAGVALSGLALARNSSWDRAQTLALRFLVRPESEADSRRPGIAFCVLGAIVYVAQIVVLFPLNDRFTGEDEEAYLITATEIAESGGAVSLLRELYRGEFAEAKE